MSDNIFEKTIPVGPLKLAVMDSISDFGDKVDQYIVKLRDERNHSEEATIAFRGYVEDTYKIPVQCSWLQGLSVWGEANNVCTATKYKGLDPEFSSGNSVLYQGIDAGYLPQSRNFTLGVTVNL